jgi:kumamolisin
MATFVPLPGSKRSLLPHSRAAGPIDPAQVASLTVRVRSKADPEALARKAYELANTPIAKRKYLTHEELEKQHGASQEDLDRIEHFAQKHDLIVVHRSAAERSIVLKGKLGDLLAAFPADVQMYHHPRGT